MSFVRPAPWHRLVLVSLVFACAHIESSFAVSQKRVVIDASAPSWSAIGRVNTSGKGHCTGVLITPNTVLTAAHCVWNRKAGKPYPAKELHFLAGYQKGSYVAHSRATSVTLNPQYLTKGRITSTNWAVIKLVAPAKGVQPIPLATLDTGSLQQLYRDGIRIEQAGYSGERPYVLTGGSDCGPFGSSGKKELLLHSCKASRGDSGSPLIATINNRRQVIALHVGRVHRGGQQLGMALPASAITPVLF